MREPLDTAEGHEAAMELKERYELAAKRLHRDVKFKLEIICTRQGRNGYVYQDYGLFIDDGPEVSSYSTSTPSTST